MIVKKIVALAGLALPLAAAAATPATWGEHGMVLFGGKDGLYAAHLPMFHAPHDYQVLLKIHVADTALDAALKQRLDGQSALWTIAPEKFELARLAPQAQQALTRFKADLVLGHFEKDGKTVYAGAELLVDKVLLYRQLAPAPARSATASYLRLAAGPVSYLVKQVDSRPDFDHIAVCYGPAGGALSPVSYTLPKQALRQPSGPALAATLQPPARRCETIYFSTEDLQ